MEKQGKIKRLVITDRAQFVKTKEFLIREGKDFTLTSSGNVDKILYDNREFTSLDTSTSGGRGHHLNRMFLKDIDSWLEEKGDTLGVWGNNYVEQMFNLDAIEKNIGKCLVSIDINDCYWRTAHKLGYITYESYIIGKRNRDWKIGRNACIGSLCKTTTVIPYVGGKVDSSKREIIRRPMEYQYIRNHIITHVFKMFEYLFSMMGNTFFMFLTDCIVTTYDKKRWVEQYFKDEGYRVKTKPVEFLSVDRVKKRVTWKDFEGTKKNSYGTVVQKGVERYYEYSLAQVVQSQIEDTSMFFKGKG
jgi:hypothetical protein